MRKNLLQFSLLLITTFLFSTMSWGQINTYPSFQGFESAFTTGTNVQFLTNWTGNTVASSNGIHRRTSNQRTGNGAMRVTPTSNFNGEVTVALNLVGRENASVSFLGKITGQWYWHKTNKIKSKNIY